MIVHRILAPATLALLSATALAGPTVHDVNQVGVAFSPASITVAPGDVVRWHHGNGNHTVTSGTKCVAGGAVVIFDEPLTAANPLVEVVIPEDFSGTIDYFCMPHCALFGMEGTIEVVAPPCLGDADGSGEVGFGDVIAVLAAWGGCPAGEPCPADFDASGEVSFPDLLTVLSNWGPC